MSHNHPPHIPHPPYPPIPDPDNPNAPYVDVGQFKPFRAWSSRVIHDHGLERKAYKGQVLPDIMTFGSIALGSVSASQSVVVTNVGFRPLPIVDVVGVGDFIVTTNCPIGGNLPPGEACIVSVTFAPKRLGSQSGGVYVNTGNAAGTEFVQLLGSGIDGVGPGDGITISISDATIESVGTGGANLSLSPLSLAFGNVELGSDSSTLSLTLSNTGSEAAQITALNVTGDFSFVTPSAGVGTTIPAGGSVTIRVRFTPTVLGSRTGEVSLNTSVQTGGSFTVPLSGTGAEEIPEPVDPLQRLRIVGNQFVGVDSGLPVRLKSVNWFGAEGGNFTPHGTWVRPWKDILDHIKAMGFNCIRVPFSGDFTASGLIPPQNVFDSVVNDDLLGLTALEILDKYFDYCAELGLYVVLDHHRRTAGNGADGTPIAGAYTMASWKASWAVMCNRYKNHIAVVGADLHNEPHDLSWSTWASYAEEVGNHVLSLAPLWLIFVEGVGTNNDTTQYWWGGALKDVRTRPVVLSVPNKVVYSPHEYGQSVGHQQWLAYDGQTVPANWPLNLSAVWDANWGYIFYDKIAPIWIGEMGGHFGLDPVTGALDKPHAAYETQWMQNLIRYLNYDRDADGVIAATDKTNASHRGMSFAYWSFNPNSFDTGGLVRGNWTTPQQPKLDLIAPLLDNSDMAEPGNSTVPFPGRRVALIGDSITYMNHSFYDAGRADGRFNYYSFSMCGYWTWANAITGNRLELEPALQPDLNGYHNGLNVGVSSSRVANWWTPYGDLGNIGTSDVGPMYAALNNLDKFDIAVIMGGTNDLAGNASAASVATKLQQAATEIAAAGKWVFLMTLCPRTTDLLTGYTVTQQTSIRNRVQQVNDLLRTWIATNPANVFFVDYYNDIVGPNGIDPAGLVSSTTSANAGSSLGNYRTDAPGMVYFHDGLHPGPAAAYAMGKKLAEAIIAAGVPAKEVGKLGPLSLGPNLIANPVFSVSTARPTDGKSSVLGRAIGLGNARTDATHAAGPSPLNNVGLGYQHGQVPNYWFVYRLSNTDVESYSNFSQFTWEALVGQFPQLIPYMPDSTWANGALKTTITTVNGVSAIRLDFTTPQTGNKNEGFVFWTFIPEGHHGPWDDYNNGNVVVPNNVYAAGDVLAGEMEVRFTNIRELVMYRMALDILSVNQNDRNTYGSKMTALGMGNNWWPPSTIDRVRMHPEDKTLHLRTPAVIVPASTSSETQRYARFGLQVSLDASQGPASVSITIMNPAVRKVTGSLT